MSFCKIFLSSFRHIIPQEQKYVTQWQEIQGFQILFSRYNIENYDFWYLDDEYKKKIMKKGLKCHTCNYTNYTCLYPTMKYHNVIAIVVKCVKCKKDIESMWNF